ncbi:hypothetical protein B0T17DRAFT_486868 [Bombardia bombarda]|uniref:Ubiquitin carboxyl-terminal hydrolase n=1 Tax=Bombardia bombarda TaxID=252184 RepID=A0AA40C8P0_9PEZI|nr:hypothetical protein B0T17DRAFT_486868 [Bombardia bombarda]
MAGSTTMLDHGGSAQPINGQKAFGLGSDGGRDGRGARRPLPHIDDIISVTADVDHQAPIEKILAAAETYFKQAESSMTFGRPDSALKDYIRAYIIAVDKIKKNKGWVLMQHDNKIQYDRYRHLLRRIEAVQGDFEKIKADIKADNARTGVQPTVRLVASNGGRTENRNGHGIGTHTEGPEKSNSSTVVKENGVPRRTPPPPPPPRSKPVVHPKPENLHGNALPPVGAGTPSSKTAQDLAQRFANLRTNNTVPGVQDPRIRTHTIIPPKLITQPNVPPKPPLPAPPTLPESYRVSTSVSETLAEMPRLPDAIYNPARGTVSSEAAELPSSAPRAIFTRTNSIVSSPATSKGPKSPIFDEYFIPAQAYGPPSTPAKRTKLPIPEGNVISIDDLLRFMRIGAKDISILLIDIRSREEFDEGHIMSQATICLESEVLTREHISANEIADSMILAPAEELLLFEKRHEFDLVVFYDQQSDRINTIANTPEERAIVGLYNALSQYDFSGDSTSSAGPKLLQGGLDAWTSLVGHGALQTSTTTSQSSHARTPMARAFLNRRQQYITRPIQDPEEAKRWEESIADVGAISPIRTTDAFLRRYPAVSAMQESMVSPITSPTSRPTSPYPFRLSHEEDLKSSLPSPPTRPPPTLPRRSYSGLADVKESSTVAKRTSVKPGLDHVRKYRTGLQNPGVFCFANSSLQSMFSTPGFGRDLWSSDWKDIYTVPRKPDEKFDNPQLLTKCLANLFHWLDVGTFKVLEAKTLMDYIHHIHSKTIDGRKKPEAEIFGGNAQQDAQEFYSFIMDNIHDETDIHRDKKPSKEEKPYTPKDGTVIQNATDYWRDYSTASASIIDKYFRGLEVFISSCHNHACRQEIRLFQPCDVWILNLAGVSDPTDLDHLLTNHQAPEHFPDLLCETCNKPGRTRKSKFARLPDRLTFCLNRFNNTNSSSKLGGSSNKIHTKVRFPIRDLDLTRYCAEPDPDMSSTEDMHFAGRMRYDCYAVTVHVGQGINGGHYYSYVQDEQSRDPTDWFRCNDDVVERVKIGSGPGDVTEAMYQSGNTSAYMVHYRRQGT